jgi:D-beta-D-heptose 7-phosphate kinase/D-beta-D-heptose 1-phosphate adenosyltransferase
VPDRSPTDAPRPHEVPETAAAVVDGFAALRVLVVGDAILDSYLAGSARRLSREAPVPVVALSERHDAPGGAANTAVNVATLGARVAFASLVGRDAEGERLLDLLDARGVETSGVVRDRGRRTEAKSRVVADGQTVVRFDQGDGAPAGADAARRLLEVLRAEVPRADAVIVSDYSAGVLAPPVVAELRRLCAGRLLLADSGRLDSLRALRPAAVTPNHAEACALLGLDPDAHDGDRAAALVPHAPALLELTAAGVVAVTLDRDGALVAERGRPPVLTAPRPVRAACATGAGDTFAAALALALGAGAPAELAAEVAAAAAAIAVAKDGTAGCPQPELRRAFGVRGKWVVGVAEIARLAHRHRRAGARIVLTNGCFDLLHRGHVAYLEQAAKLGDVLIVALNGDDSVRRLKGPDRPLTPLEDRVEVIAALGCVDHVVSFGEDRPTRLIEAIRPDVLAKGGDYTRATVPEAALVEQLGGRVEIVSEVGGRSTTGLVERIRDRHGGDERVHRARART